MKKLNVNTTQYEKYKRLALVWEDKDYPTIIIPLDEITEEDYKKYTEWFGKTPVGRSETFLRVVL